MNILKQIYKGGTLALLIAVTACSAEQFTEEAIAPGTTPISPMGALTRSGDTSTPDVLGGYASLYLSALINNGSADIAYFTNKGLTVGDATTNGKYKLNTDVYYPVGNKEIKLYAHTGQQANGKIALTAGTDKAKNDILISNTKVNGTEGAGTAGTANANVDLLTFSHAMTKVEVAFDIADDVQDTKPSSIELTFTGNKVVKEGQYELAKAFADGAVTTPNKSDYVLKKGINYLVANGETLSEGKFIKSLKIDDYTATTEDCAALTVPKADLNGTESDFILKPGLAYTLTFKIKRLKVMEITLKMKEWDIISGDGTWGCDPYQVAMDFTGGYNNTGANAISKMVFHYTPQTSANSYQYIAKVENGTAEFLTLPADMTQGTLTADLYTTNGLLIQDHQITYTAAVSGSDIQKFGISLGANGMVKDNADGFYEVGTPLQFYNMMTNPGTDAGAAADKQYKLIKNIDISHLPLTFTPPTFPKDAVLDGNGHSILHLEQQGNGLFAVNNGTLRNLQLSFSSIKATKDTYAGGICTVNNGKIEGCINEADVITTNDQIAGGICGLNKGTILACLNTGNVPNGAEIGGICGENASSQADAIKACINAGMLHGSSNHGVTSNIGGICGYQSVASSNTVINSCYWLTGTARPVQGVNEEMAIGRLPDSATYSYDTTNMIEEKLRSEAVIKLNAALTSSNWKFEWKKNSNGTYNTVWPTPVKKANP